MMRRSSFPPFLAALLGMTALLAGCCANDTCDCDDLLEDAIQLQFRVAEIGVPTQDPASFRPDEVDTIRLVRYRLPPLPDPNATKAPATVAPDTIVVLLPNPRPRADDNAYGFTITNTAPFAISGSLRVNSYRYAILLTNDRRQTSRLRVRQRYDLSSIQLDGGYQADGCCTCYKNSRKTAYLRTSAAGTNVPARNDSISYDLNLASQRVIELTRPR